MIIEGVLYANIYFLLKPDVFLMSKFAEILLILMQFYMHSIFLTICKLLDKKVIYVCLWPGQNLKF